MPKPSLLKLVLVTVAALAVAGIGYGSLMIWREKVKLETHREESNTPTAEHLPQQAEVNETSSKSPLVRFSGEVLRGQAFEKEIVHGLIFRLVPTVPASDDGWTITIGTQKTQDYDFSRVVTPPYRGVVNDLYVEGWHFRNADNSGPNDGSVNAPQEIREFSFVFNEVDAEEASNLLGKILWPANEEEQEEFDNNLALHEAIPKGTGRLTIKGMKLGNLKIGERAWIDWMRFDVEFFLRLELIHSEEIIQEHPEVDTSDWKTYQNEQYGFTVQYPNGWHAYDENTWKEDSSLNCDQAYSLSNILILSRGDLGSCVGVLLWSSWPGDFIIRLMDKEPPGFPYVLGKDYTYEVIKISGAFGVKYPFTENSELPRKQATRVYTSYGDRAYIIEFVQTDKEGNYDLVFDGILESIRFSM